MKLKYVAGKMEKAGITFIVVQVNSDVFDANFYAFIINSLPVAVLTVDADLKITRFNPWAEEITGYREEEAIGHYCGEILKGGMCGTDCPLKAVINHESTVTQVETTIFNRQVKTGVQRHIHR